MRRLIRYLACSAASFLFIAGIVGFTGHVLAPAGARLSDSGTGQHGRHGPPKAKCQPLHVFEPKHGFKPLHATNAELLAHGFPPRPPKSLRRALQLWRQVMSHARRFDRPHPACGSSSRSTVYSGNWSGHVVPKSYYGGADFTAVQSEWVQPTVPGDPNYTDYNDAPTVSIWAGVGVTNLMQAGVDSISTATPKYRFWTEDFPQKMIWEGPSISGGQIAFVFVRNGGGNQAYYFLENVTTGVYSSFTNPLPYVGINAANFVLERPNGLYLPSFSALNVWDNYFWQNSNSSQLTSVNNRWVMTSNCASGGTLLAQPSEISGGEFSQAWSHSRPFSNSC